ncbi:MAG: phosphohydrolase [Sneathiella sp.]
MKQDVWMITATGNEFYPFDPRPDQISLEDIVQKLSRICRYNGGVKWPLHYSVAEHSVLLARYALDNHEDPELAMQMLMHDAAEAYIGDMVRPLKEVMPEFRDIDHLITEAIFKKFNIPHPMPALVKELDHRILFDEEIQAIAPHTRRFDDGTGKPLGVTLQFWSAERAYQEFKGQWFTLRDLILNEEAD